MRGVFSLILVSSFMLAACSSQGHPNRLKSLDDLNYFQIIQVNSISNSATSGSDDQYPYYIVCADADENCFQTMGSSKQLTPVRTLNSDFASNGNATAIENTSSQYPDNSFSMPFVVHFDYARSNIAAEFHQRLNTFSSQYAGKKSIHITGYTDNLGLPDGRIHNIALALDRASSVSRYLVTRGFPRTMISLEAKALCCYIDSNENEEGRRKNRRAEINFL